MKFQAALLVVKNMERSVKFYKEVLGLRVTMDLGANVTLTGGVALQTQESWCEFIKVSVLAAMLLNFILKKINSMIF